MKKTLVFFLICLVLVANCGSDAGKESSSSQPIIADPITEISDGTVNDSDSDTINVETGDQNSSEEKITVMVNESYALKYVACYEEKVKNAIDHANIVFNRSDENKKKFSVEKTITYSDKNVNEVYNGKVSYFNNGYSNSYGTTVVLFLYDEEESKPEMFSKYNGFHRTRTFSNRKKLEETWVAYNINSSPFSNITSDDGDVYEAALQPLIHELGHASGLAEEEIYRYFFSDHSDVLPKLSSYYPWAQFQELLNDPMFNKISPLKFSSFNSWMINKNYQHEYGGEQIAEEIPDLIKVKVLDSLDNPIPKAKVQVFAALWGDVHEKVSVIDPILLLEAETDADGEAVINIDDSEKSTYEGLTIMHKFSPKLAAKIIKVKYGEFYAGRYLTLYELERAHLQDGLDTYVISMYPEFILFE